MSYADTTDRYPVKGEVVPVTREMKMNTAVTIHQGDGLYWDAGNSWATPATADTDGATFCGVMLGRIPPASGVAGNLTVDHAPVIREGVVMMLSTAEESYVHGAAVQFGDASCQQVKLIGQDATTQIIGHINLPNSATITGAAGTYVPVLIRVGQPAAY